MKKFLVTGGAGFIGSNFVELALEQGHQVVVLDLLTYAGHPENLEHVKAKIEFVRGDIRDRAKLSALFDRHHFDVVVNFAAESHVDRSIENAGVFVETNVLGVLSLLDVALREWTSRTPSAREHFRFVQVSTDEVFGSLQDGDLPFTEKTAYAPSSPYSASKAGGDHLVRAWHHTYGLPALVTNCSNNYGPRQFPEKLIPYMIRCAIEGKKLPVYGNGRNVRDWIHVKDHCAGIMLAIEKGQLGESYCFGGRSERRNINVVEAICDELDRLTPRGGGESYRTLISYVEDRKGHDWRYAIDDAKAESELGFIREYTRFEDGLKQTVAWYLKNQEWMRAVLKTEGVAK